MLLIKALLNLGSSFKLNFWDMFFQTTLPASVTVGDRGFQVGHVHAPERCIKALCIMCMCPLNSVLI